jgi:excisionase family DNA binding protein
MTVKEASKVLGLKVRTIRQWITEGKLKAEKQGCYWSIPEEEVFKKEVQENANKAREHSRRIKEGSKVGMLYEAGQNSEKPAEWKECEK